MAENARSARSRDFSREHVYPHARASVSIPFRNLTRFGTMTMVRASPAPREKRVNWHFPEQNRIRPSLNALTLLAAYVGRCLRGECGWRCCHGTTITCRLEHARR